MHISIRSWILVSLQFLLISAVFLSGKWYPVNWYWVIPYLAGWLLFLAAAAEFRKSKITVFPELRHEARLITSGVYALIRHPFYTAVLLVTASLVADQFSLLRLLAVLLLGLVLLIKISHEESILIQAFNKYDEYRKNTWKLIPWIY